MFSFNSWNDELLFALFGYMQIYIIKIPLNPLPLLYSGTCTSVSAVTLTLCLKWRGVGLIMQHQPWLAFILSYLWHIKVKQTFLFSPFSSCSFLVAALSSFQGWGREFHVILYLQKTPQLHLAQLCMK